MSRLSLLGNFFSIASADVISRAIRFFYFIFIARLLNQSDVGIFYYGMAFYLPLLALASFGQGPLLASRVGRGAGHFSLVVAHSRRIVSWSLGLSMAIAAAYIFLMETDQRVRIVLLIFSFTVLARGYSAWIRSVFIAEEKAAWIPKFELAFRSMEVTCGIITLLMGGDLFAICILHLLFWVLEAIAARQRLQHAINPAIARRHSVIKKYALASAPITISLFLMTLFPQTAILVLFQINAGSTGVASFAIAMQLLAILFIVPFAAGQAILPGLERTRRSGNPVGFHNLIAALKLCLIGSLIIAAASASISPWLVPIIFGAGYSESGWILAKLLWGLGPFCAAFISISALNGLGARREALIAASLCVACQVAGIIALDHFSNLAILDTAAYTFVVATTVSMMAGIVSLTAVLNRVEHQIDYSWWVRTTLLVLVATGVGLSQWVPPVLMTLLGPLILLLAVFAFRLMTRQEIHDFYSRFAK